MKVIKYHFLIFPFVLLFILVGSGVALSQERYDFVTKWGSLGEGNGQFKKPYGIAVGASGNVYVADYLNYRIQKFSSTGSYLTEWGSVGTGNGQFGCPNSIALDSSENVYVTDECNHRVQKFTSAGVYSTQWGTQGVGNGQFNYPTGIAVDSSNKVYVVDKNNNRIQVFSSTGVYSTQWGTQGSANGQLYYPQGVAVDSSGNVYVADTGNNRIQKYNNTGLFLGYWGSSGSGDGQFMSLQQIVVDPAGYVYAVDATNTRIQKFTSIGTFVYGWGTLGSGDGQFKQPYGLAVNINGDVYASDVSNNNVQKFSHYCTYTFTPSNQAFNAVNHTGSISVTPSPLSCTWTAASQDSWITVTGGATGSGTGTVSYSVSANSNVERSGSIVVGGQSFSVSQAGWIYSNSIGSKNSIKFTDLSGILSSSGATITVSAWDANGNSIAESGSATALKLYNNGTTTVTGTALSARFPSATPWLYAFTADSSRMVITNIKISTDGTLNIPNGYTSGTTNFAANAVGARNMIKITDVSGTLSAVGAAISISAWDAGGNIIPESDSVSPLKLFNHGTTVIGGSELQARFPSAIPMVYEFTVASSKYVITNVKSNTEGTINIPYSYTSGTTNFVANTIGSRNTIKISDLSGTLSSSGAAITVSAWDADGNALAQSETASSLKLYSHGTTVISGSELQARFPSATPMTYEFIVDSAKYIISNIKSSADGTVNLPYVYASGTTNYAINSVSSLTAIKITDITGNISSAGNAITVAAWDANGQPITESGSAQPLKIYSFGTTTISGADLIARFPNATPVLYEVTIWSTKFIVTNLTANTDRTINIPNVYINNVAGGI